LGGLYFSQKAGLCSWTSKGHAVAQMVVVVVVDRRPSMMMMMMMMMIDEQQSWDKTRASEARCD